MHRQFRPQYFDGVRAASLGGLKFESYSAGSAPRPAPHPMVLEELRHQNYDTEGLRSKDWSEFAQLDSPHTDFAITVCDDAHGWPGQPMSAHWGIEDPHAFEGEESERRWLIRRVLRELENRIKIFVSLPIDALDKLALQERLDEIGRGSAETPTHQQAS